MRRTLRAPAGAAWGEDKIGRYEIVGPLFVHNWMNGSAPAIEFRRFNWPVPSIGVPATFASDRLTPLARALLEMPHA